MNSHKGKFWWRKGLEFLTAKKLQTEMRLLHYVINARAIPQRRRVYYKPLKRISKKKLEGRNDPAKDT